jgi:hypothetical protein
MRKDAHGGGWFFNGRDEFELPATVLTALNVDVEHSLPDH